VDILELVNGRKGREKERKRREGNQQDRGFSETLPTLNDEYDREDEQKEVRLY